MLRIARDLSDVSVYKQTNDLPKTAKTITVKGLKKRKHPSRSKHEKSTPIHQNKQTVPTTKSRSEMNHDNNSKKTENPKNRKNKKSG